MFAIDNQGKDCYTGFWKADRRERSRGKPRSDNPLRCTGSSPQNTYLAAPSINLLDAQIAKS
jgi:hypothetical protein